MLKEQPIGALVKTSLVDFQGCVCAVLFLHGCNLRCPYCYNSDIINAAIQNYDAVTLTQVKLFLEKRKNVLSGFVLSGGEPLLSACTMELILFAKSLGYKIKLDTNGTLPLLLQHILENPQTKPDYLAMDFKTSLERYNECAGERVHHQNLAEAILSSIQLLQKLPPLSYEFRTVLVPSFVGKTEIEKIAGMLPKDATWYFAPFHNKHCVNPDFEKIHPYSPIELQELVSFAQTFIQKAVLR